MTIDLEEDGVVRKITGVIFSDLGQGASFMALSWVQDILREKLGFAPYPATLNLRLESEREMALWKEIRREMKGISIPPPGPAFCHARCFPVQIEGPLPGRQASLMGAVLFPEVEGYPADKIEMVAPVRIKESLKVGDGDRLTLKFLDP